MKSELRWWQISDKHGAPYCEIVDCMEEGAIETFRKSFPENTNREVFAAEIDPPEK